MCKHDWESVDHRSFIVPLPLIYGPLYLVYLVYPWLFLNKQSWLLVGIEVLGKIGQHLIGVLFCSILCGTYGENRIIESLKGRSILLSSLSAFSICLYLNELL